MNRQRTHQSRFTSRRQRDKSPSATGTAFTRAPAPVLETTSLPAAPWTFGKVSVHGAPLSADSGARALTRAWPGFDFSRVRLDTSGHAAERAASMGVPAFTYGNTIAFAPGGFAPSTDAGRHVLAHELAHVVQQQQGLTRTLGSGSRAALENDAEQNARLAVSGEAVLLPPRLGSPAQATQTFDPEYHEQATIGGLTGIFASDEIGKVYEANWRRDFSQGPAVIAELVLTWKELKRFAAQHNGKTDSGMQFKLLKTVSLLPNQMATQPGNTYGGYQYFEHMDNPGGAAAAEADQRWGTGPGDLPGYIRDSRASIKDKLTTAIQSARDSWGGLKPDSGRSRADAWAKGTPPATYDIGDPWKDRAMPPQGYGVPKNIPDPQTSSSVVARDVSDIAANQPGAKSGPATKGFASDPAVADNLGRASHLIEDFFAHSNFVELAQSMKPGQPVSPSALRTGTFEGADQAHSLAGKLRDAAEDIKANRQLIPLVADSVISTLEGVSKTAEAASRTMGVKPGSHTKLAKDSPHAGGNFPMALELATHADQMIFWYVHKIMEKSSPDKALSEINILYMLVDAIINVPSDNHPLKNVFSPQAAQPAAP